MDEVDTRLRFLELFRSTVGFRRPCDEDDVSDESTEKVVVDFRNGIVGDGGGVGGACKLCFPTFRGTAGAAKPLRTIGVGKGEMEFCLMARAATVMSGFDIVKGNDR